MLPYSTAPCLSVFGLPPVFFLERNESNQAQDGRRPQVRAGALLWAQLLCRLM